MNIAHAIKHTLKPMAIAAVKAISLAVNIIVLSMDSIMITPVCPRLSVLLMVPDS